MCCRGPPNSLGQPKNPHLGFCLRGLARSWLGKATRLARAAWVSPGSALGPVFAPLLLSWASVSQFLSQGQVPAVPCSAFSEVTEAESARARALEAVSTHRCRIVTACDISRLCGWAAWPMLDGRLPGSRGPCYGIFHRKLFSCRVLFSSEAGELAGSPEVLAVD